jgi:hypothetical protein
LDRTTISLDWWTEKRNINGQLYRHTKPTLLYFLFPHRTFFNFLKPTAQMAHLQNRTSPTSNPSFAKEPFFSNAPGNNDNFVH